MIFKGNQLLQNAHYYIFTPCLSKLGVHHLIDFESNRTILSGIQFLKRLPVLPPQFAGRASIAVSDPRKLRRSVQNELFKRWTNYKRKKKNWDSIPRPLARVAANRVTTGMRCFQLTLLAVLNLFHFIDQSLLLTCLGQSILKLLILERPRLF